MDEDSNLGLCVAQAKQSVEKAKSAIFSECTSGPPWKGKCEIPSLGVVPVNALKLKTELSKKKPGAVRTRLSVFPENEVYSISILS